MVSEISPVQVLRSESLQQGHIMTMHTYIPTNVPRKCQLPTPYGAQKTAWTRLTTPPNCQPTHPPTQQDTMGENNTAQPL